MEGEAEAPVDQGRCASDFRGTVRIGEREKYLHIDCFKQWHQKQCSNFDKPDFIARLDSVHVDEFTWLIDHNL